MTAAVVWIDDRPESWDERALCAQVDPELFFPERGGSARGAKRVCGACPVRSECLEDALVRGDRFGIRGGLSERERRPLHRERDAAGLAAAVADLGGVA